MASWKCQKCGYTIEADKPPEQCPSCKEKCEFLDNTCYTPDCVAEGVDERIGQMCIPGTDSICTHNEKDLQGYDALVFGSATYHGDMMQGMKTMLFLSEKADLEGKVGGFRCVRVER